MDYKKKYNAAFERARYYHSKDYMLINSAIENIFPELKESESEDERMKKAIKHVLYENYTDAAVIEGVEIAEIIAWLEEQGQTFTKKDVDDAYLQGICDAKHEIEKQGEQGHAELGQSEVTKTSDQELEPRFKVGDWVIANDGTHTYIVKERKRGIYVILDIGEDKEFCIDIESADRTGRLWTIQDAKDGDVLVCPSDLGDRLVVFIFKQLVNRASEIYCHCCIDANGIFDPCLNNCCYVGDAERADYSPATKKQRDLLFQKMKEAGYEWDAEKKELKKMEVASKESEDEKIRKDIIAFLLSKNRYMTPNEDWDFHNKWLVWLEKQREKLDPDKVIGWLIANICDFEYYVNLFRKDFEL